MSGRNRHLLLTVLETASSRRASALFMRVTLSTAPVRDTQIFAWTTYSMPPWFIDVPVRVGDAARDDAPVQERRDEEHHPPSRGARAALVSIGLERHGGSSSGHLHVLVRASLARFCHSFD